MKIIQRIGQGVNVQPLLWALMANPQLWNEHSARTKPKDSPHREVDDIWVRYAEGGITGEPHESIWYSSADMLPVREIVFPLMAMLDGERLGGVLITRTGSMSADEYQIDSCGSPVMPPSA